MEEVFPEVYTLDDYRNRYALYKLDSDLQAAHANFPWIVTLDDHEVDGNWADEVPQDPDLQSKEDFLKRRAVAFQAYYEHMPLRRTSVSKWDGHATISPPFIWKFSRFSCTRHTTVSR